MTDWTDAKIEILRVGVAEGLSYSQIAKRVGDGCTRCAAIGKARRVGLVQPGTAAKPAMTRRTYRTSPPVPRPLRITARNQVFAEPEPREPTVVVAFPTEAAGLRTVLNIRTFECRYPIGEPGDAAFTFCGKSCAGSWCLDHAKRVFQPSTGPTAKRANELQRSLRRYL